ncbi:hypothetical protein ACFFGR_09295 [Arthrobacter liuii]|uniref:Glycosyl hydrolases family 16 n=1 Tax=Arthrobacter liuii TaxID=1476996 RepID=A0ABQ2AQ80_9MICC|nr:hypothetical protein [Arthrobacter liuii]GGH93817.1 hypothetical protein GCM10007170_15570 [Arthrobacter liuii]
MGTESREGRPFTTEGFWGAEEHHTHALEVHHTSDIVTYYVDGEPAARFMTWQFEDLMRMASTIGYLKQPQEWPELNS